MHIFFYFASHKTSPVAGIVARFVTKLKTRQRSPNLPSNTHRFHQTKLKTLKFVYFLFKHFFNTGECKNGCSYHLFAFIQTKKRKKPSSLCARYVLKNCFNLSFYQKVRVTLNGGQTGTAKAESCYENVYHEAYRRGRKPSNHRVNTTQHQRLNCEQLFHVLLVIRLSRKSTVMITQNGHGKKIFSSISDQEETKPTKNRNQPCDKH